MKLLLLSFYFRPDLSAGSFRTSALVEALLAADETLEIDVVTTLPNRYSSFSSEAPELEESPRLRIHRIALPRHQSGMRDQSVAFLRFAMAAMKIARRTRYDMIYATSSRLMTALLGTAMSWRQKSPLYLDIRDIFVDTIEDVLPRFAWATGAIFAPLERLAIGRAKAVNLVSRGFEPYFAPRYPRKQFRYFTNGVDDEFIGLTMPVPTRAEGEPLRVLYAGNIGDGQGLHAVLPKLARALTGRVHFRILGDGGRRPALEAALAASGVDNVEIMPPVNRGRLIEEYAAADVLFLHLNDYPSFLKVLPSKLFEYAATGKPIWAGLSGYPASFAQKEIPNAAVFYPCDPEAGVAALQTLQLTPTDRADFVTTYGRRKIMKDMATDMLSQMDPRGAQS